MNRPPEKRSRANGTFMFIAGEPSGDLIAAELVRAVGSELGVKPRCFGAGGPAMAQAGVELAFDLTSHAVVGLLEVLRQYPKFKRLFDQLISLALERRPEIIVCVDFSGFNRRFAQILRWETRVRGIHDWRPLIVQYVSPQVWASRPGRAQSMARDFDLLLTLFPFEKPWYAQRVPKLRVAFVGHPIFDRYAPQAPERSTAAGMLSPLPSDSAPLVVLLPGSREGELRRHLPVMFEAWNRIQAAGPKGTHARMILPNESLLQQVRTFAVPAGIELQTGGLAQVLSQACLAIASTGTVTLECAYFLVPTVALYKTSWSTYQIGKRIIQVQFLAMPNLLANEVVYPEFVQDQATGGTIAEAALALLHDRPRREKIRARLAQIMETLGGPGAARRAAQAILALIDNAEAPARSQPKK